jgi:uncharacterized protein Smg (DUF494 family)
MNAGSNLQSLESTNPTLFNVLVDHPEIRVVECYFHLETNQFSTMWKVVEKLLGLGFTRQEISEAFKIYMTA